MLEMGVKVVPQQECCPFENRNRESGGQRSCAPRMRLRGDVLLSPSLKVQMARWLFDKADRCVDAVKVISSRQATTLIHTLARYTGKKQNYKKGSSLERGKEIKLERRQANTTAAAKTRVNATKDTEKKP